MAECRSCFTGGRGGSFSALCETFDDILKSQELKEGVYGKKKKAFLNVFRSF